MEIENSSATPSYVKSSRQSCNDDRERTSLMTLLSGLDLKKEEIQLFDDENIDLQTFALLSEKDLIQIGIKEPEKRTAVMKIVFNLQTRKTKEKENIKFGPLSWKDGLAVVTNSSQHLDLLHGVMQYLRSQQCNCQRKYHLVDGFLDKEWSCSMGLLACIAAAVSQSHYTCQELEHLKLRAAEGTAVIHKTEYRGINRRLTSLLIASLAIVGFVLWRINR